MSIVLKKITLEADGTHFNNHSCYAAGGVAAKAGNDKLDIKDAKDGESDGVKEVGTDDGAGDVEVAGVVNTDGGNTDAGGDNSDGSGDNSDGAGDDAGDGDGTPDVGLTGISGTGSDANVDTSDDTDGGDDEVTAPAPAPAVETTTDGGETDGGDAEALAPEAAAPSSAGDGLELPALQSGAQLVCAAFYFMIVAVLYDHCNARDVHVFAQCYGQSIGSVTQYQAHLLHVRGSKPPAVNLQGVFMYRWRSSILPK